MALADDINALPITVGDGNTGHLNNHQVIHAGLKSHEERLTTHRHASEGITDAVSTIPASPNRVVKTNADGKISITTASITAQGDPVNKAYVDGRIPDTLPLRLDTTVGTRIFAGATMIHGDTGLRNISSFMSSYTSSTGSITLERTGATVSMDFYVRQFDVKGAVANDLLLTLPAGFRPTGSYRFTAQQPGGVTLQVATNGQVTVVSGSINSGSYVTFNFMHLTRDAWPTSLPGTPA